MGDTLVAEVLLANRHHLDGVPVPRPLSLGEKRLLVITCMDPRLTALLPLAMGVGADEMIQIRSAGNRALTIEGDPVRSAVAAVVLKMADEVFVIGHTDCAMCGASTMDLLDGMQERGLPREAFEGRDIRTWFGLIASERSNAMETARVVRESPFLPPGTPVHALLVDSAGGKLEMLEEGYSRAAKGLPSVSVAPTPVPSFEPTSRPIEGEVTDSFRELEQVEPLPSLEPEPPPSNPMSSPPPPPLPIPRQRRNEDPESPFERAEDVLARLMKRRRQ